MTKDLQDNYAYQAVYPNNLKCGTAHLCQVCHCLQRALADAGTAERSHVLCLLQVALPEHISGASIAACVALGGICV